MSDLNEALLDCLLIRLDDLSRIPPPAFAVSRRPECA
jgi:hypothetical protein